jgi:quercetin dioxygenase-like cupin family protein
MKIVPAHDPGSPAEKRSATFTGTVWGDPVAAQDGVTINTVYFEPGARTYWHAHEGGQALHVTSGSGWVATRGQEARRVRSGDVVWASPGEEHWHGAGDDSFLVHIAVSLGSSQWLGEVTPEEYQARQDPENGR